MAFETRVAAASIAAAPERRLTPWRKRAPPNGSP